MAKTTRAAYILWFFGGPFGFHHLYLGRDLHALVWWFTFGGFIVGWIRDFWRIPAYVAEANQEPAYVSKLKEEMRKNPKPLTGTFRGSGTTLFGSILGSLLVSAVPIEPIFGYDLQWICCFAPLSVAIGTYIVGNIGRQHGPLRNSVIASYSTHLLYSLFFSTKSPPTVWCSLVSAWAFGRAKDWRRTPRKRKNIFKRIGVLLACYMVYVSLIVSALYFNAEFTDQNGETVKFRDSFTNVLNSPVWGQLWQSIEDVYNIVRNHGWQRLWEEIATQLDFQGENNAMKVLGLDSSATQTDITQRWRQLSREWHPDKQRDPEKKAEAHTKFTEIQAAYARLSEIKNRRLKKNERNRSPSAAEKMSDEL